MAQAVLITLTSAGADTGPFDLYSNLDGYTVPFETSVPKVDLEAGYISYLVPDGATDIRVQSTNVLCQNYIDLTINTTTTTTSTSTSSTTTTSTSTSPSITVFMSLADGTEGTPEWRAVWNTGGGNKTSICIGTETDGPDSMLLLSSTVTCTVTRPSGTTLDNFEITWLINGINAPSPDGFGQVNPETGPSGTAINYTYTFTGINANDQLQVFIIEG